MADIPTMPGGSGGKFSALLLEGLDHYRKGRMLEAVRAWEEAYLLEPTNLRAREFLRSALERIHAHMGPKGGNGQPAAAPTHPWLPAQPPAPPPATPPVQPEQSGSTQMFASPPMPSSGGQTQTFATPPLPTKSEPPPTTSPWDDGPSVAIPQPEDPGDKSSDAWTISSAPLPMEAVADEETDVWMRGAREMFGLNDFSGALELLGKIIERKPGDKEAQQMYESCEHNLTLMYESKIGTMDARPRIAIPPDEIIWLNLDPRAGFVLAQIDGEVSFDDLYAICGLKRLDTARILCQLLEEGVVQVQGQDKAVAKRAMHRS
ncbi:MAG: hypothetical protein ABR567_20955 [Myxococcales bacterium]